MGKVRWSIHTDDQYVLDKLSWAISRLNMKNHNKLKADGSSATCVVIILLFCCYIIYFSLYTVKINPDFTTSEVYKIETVTSQRYIPYDCTVHVILTYNGIHALEPYVFTMMNHRLIQSR
jgi:hypothetical protein